MEELPRRSALLGAGPGRRSRDVGSSSSSIAAVVPDCARRRRPPRGETTRAEHAGRRSASPLVPAAIKSKGTLTVAADASYAPNEFIAPDGHTVVGMDADLVRRSAGDGPRRSTSSTRRSTASSPGWRPASTTSAPPRSPTPRRARRPSTSSTTSTPASPFFTKASGGASITGLADLCGKTVAVEKGTTEETDGTAQSAKCKKAGKPAVTVLVFPDQNGANLALSSGRAQLGMADSPVGRLRGQAVKRPVQAGRPDVRRRALRSRDPQEGQRSRPRPSLPRSRC